MKITRTPGEIEALWVKARRATDGAYFEYAEGVYATLQWLTGNGDEPELEAE